MALKAFTDGLRNGCVVTSSTLFPSTKTSTCFLSLSPSTYWSPVLSPIRPDIALFINFIHIHIFIILNNYKILKRIYVK
ncbi:hypothetical protein TUZN_0950 [Thermoproteus uzoniensis 768-20]|uniref:Uncharacterized protein n=1 Tax=Thermoproteus uzoniensis (strain 768-20) TaxID=999630 RepID=F2L5Y8_THEU7|nr:hypothetical protein TUZN_0950 [Thermoproteus uzoniensis 768-20]